MILFDLEQYEYPMEEVFEGDDFTPVTNNQIEDQSRWTTYYSQILQYKDGSFWKAFWERGSTEYQDDTEPNLSLVKVTPKEVTVTMYTLVE